MSFPSKEDREKCWSSRDALWKCLDENGSNTNSNVCAEFRKMYENSCPSQWVKHFDRKREYLKFKDRIQNEGSQPFLLGGEGTENSSVGKEATAVETSGSEAVGGANSSRIYRKFQPPTFR